MKEICFEYEMLHYSLDDRDDTALHYVSWFHVLVQLVHYEKWMIIVNSVSQSALRVSTWCLV